MKWYEYCLIGVVILMLGCIILFGPKPNNNHIDLDQVAKEILEELKGLRKDINNNSVK